MVVLLLSLCFQSCMRDADLAFDNTPQGNIEALWQIIDQQYCFIEEKGIDWDAIHDEFVARVDTMPAHMYQSRELFKVMAEMLDKLHDGHVNLYSSFDISASSGWYDGYPMNYNSDLMYQYLGYDYMMAGGFQYNLTQGIPDSIGYMRYSSFQSSVADTYLYYIMTDYFRDCKGIILDVRNNGGGNLDYAYKLAASFFTQDRLVGYWQHKTGTAHDAFSPMEELWVRTNDSHQHWFRPIAILTNRRCYSATNSFVNCMKHADQCMIFGGTTGGGGGMPLSYELPNGWYVRLSSVKMYDTNKHSIEEGIEPDTIVNMTHTDRDDIIEAAIKWIREQEREEL